MSLFSIQQRAYVAAHDGGRFSSLQWAFRSLPGLFRINSDQVPNVLSPSEHNRLARGETKFKSSLHIIWRAHTRQSAKLNGSCEISQGSKPQNIG